MSDWTGNNEQQLNNVLPVRGELAMTYVRAPVHEGRS